MNDVQPPRVHSRNGPNGHSAKVLSYKGKLIEIDEEIVDLIQFLWSENIHTIECCQDGYICFADWESADKFLQLLVQIFTEWKTPGKWHMHVGSDGKRGVQLCILWRCSSLTIKELSSKLLKPVHHE